MNYTDELQLMPSEVSNNYHNATNAIADLQGSYEKLAKLYFHSNDPVKRKAAYAVADQVQVVLRSLMALEYSLAEIQQAGVEKVEGWPEEV